MAQEVPSIKVLNDVGAVLSKFTFDESFWSHDDFEVEEDGYCKAKEGGNYTDQRYVYDVFGKRVLDNAWQGYHCCLFAYGQTGSGKSYSMVGHGANRDILQFSCDELFKRAKKKIAKNKLNTRSRAR